jgi:hypothetical protein
MCVSGSGYDFEDSVINGENTDIESSTSEIENENIFLSLLFVQAVGDGCSSGLIQDSDYV